MDNKTVAAIAVSTLLLGCGVSGLLFVKPAWEEQQQLKASQASLTSEEQIKAAEVATLRTKLNSMAMSTISYFDLSRSPNQKKEMETKTVETLASITEIFNDNHIKVQFIEPKGESTGLNKPVPSPVASPSPGASPAAGAPAAPAPSPTPVPGAPVTPPPISLTHKAFQMRVRGEYPNLVKTLTEIQGLPRAISINEYTLRLINSDPNKADSLEFKADSPSLLELTFQLSVTFLMAGPVPVIAAPTPAPSAVSMLPGGALSGALFAWAEAWLCSPAFAAEAASSPHTAPTRFTLNDVKWEGGALRFKTTRGTPRFHAVRSHGHMLVVQLDDTRPGARSAFPVAGHGILSVTATPSPFDPRVTLVAIETDGSVRLKLVLNNQQQLEVRPEGGKSAKPVSPVRQAVKPIPSIARSTAKPVKPAHQAAVHTVGPLPSLKLAAPVTRITAIAPAKPPALAAAVPVAQQAKPAAAPIAKTAKLTRSTAPNGYTIVVKPDGHEEVGITANSPKVAADDWDRIAATTTAEWERQALQQVASTTHRGAVAFAPVTVAADMVRSDKPVRLVAVAKPAPVATKAPRPVAAKPAAVVAAPPVQAAKPPVSTEPTYLDGVRYERGELVILTHGAPPRFEVLGGHHSLLLVSLSNTPMAAPGRLFQVQEGGIKQVRAALYDNRDMTSRLAIDTDGSVRLIAVDSPSGQLRFRVTPFEQASLAHQAEPAPVRLSGASTSAIRSTIGRDLPSPRPTPTAKHPAIKARSVQLKPQATPRVVRRQVETVVRRTPPRAIVSRVVPLQPGATPTPMAIPRQQAQLPRTAPIPTPGTKASAKPTTTITRSKTTTTTTTTTTTGQRPAPTPTPYVESPEMGPSLTRSLNSNYSFPIDRDRTTGRVNPFKALRNPQASPRPTAVQALPPGMMNPPVPVLKPAPAGLPSIPTAPGMSGGVKAPAALPSYALQAVMIWGSQPAVAVIQVGGKPVQVGLNETLPGNARVKAIKPDYVILTANGRDIRLNLKR